MFPGIATLARLQRQFLARAVRYLADEAGIRQFLDIGTGLPTADNTHEIAQRVAPESRIVYVDNDPLVLVHARALLTSTPEGATDYIDADVRDPERDPRRGRQRRWTSASPSRSCCWASWARSPTTTSPRVDRRPRCWTRCPRAATWR